MLLFDLDGTLIDSNGDPGDHQATLGGPVEDHHQDQRRKDGQECDKC